MSNLLRRDFLTRAAAFAAATTATLAGTRRAVADDKPPPPIRGKKGAPIIGLSRNRIIGSRFLTELRSELMRLPRFRFTIRRSMVLAAELVPDLPEACHPLEPKRLVQRQTGGLLGASSADTCSAQVPPIMVWCPAACADRPGVLRVLARILAAFDTAAGFPPKAGEVDTSPTGGRLLAGHVRGSRTSTGWSPK